MDEHEPYVAYMLRLWQAGHDDGVAWRASLESPHTAEHQVFASLEALFDFLRQKTAELDQPGYGAQPSACRQMVQRAPGPKAPPGEQQVTQVTAVNRELLTPGGNKRQQKAAKGSKRR